MVQDNIDSAMDNLKRGERILQDNKENFDEMMTNMEENCYKGHYLYKSKKIWLGNGNLRRKKINLKT